MAEALVERAWAWLHATFPERQIYIRSEGRVQFFTFGSTLQATCAGLFLIFLGWVAFASVNVIFKDRIIAAKNHRFQQMQSNYENRVADLELSYDELNNALVSAEDQFKSTADELGAKEQSVASLLGKKQNVDASLAAVGGSSQTADRFSVGPIASVTGSGNNMASDSLGSEETAAPPSSDGFAISPASPSADSSRHGNGASQLNVMPQPIEPQPRTARPNQASFLDDTVSRFTELLFRPSRRQAIAVPSDAPGLRVLTEQIDRVKQLSDAQTGLLVSLDNTVSNRVADLRRVLDRVGVNSARLEQASDAGMGGPLVPLQSVHVEGVADAAFASAYEDAAAHTAELGALFTALRHVPLATPVAGSRFEMTSGFGPRVDPFTRRVAFHTGMDFAGPWGSAVVATAEGVIVWAGPRAGYGNMVEIDHGYGIHTRYGHLEAILVRVGSHVVKGTSIGKLGSTGRSTGPHVHYEVLLADSARDPSKFIEAGRHVLE
jgi:murein DD-endopeptidase MepM/ murein hydrolase activator NlpD